MDPIRPSLPATSESSLAARTLAASSIPTRSSDNNHQSSSALAPVPILARRVDSDPESSNHAHALEYDSDPALSPSPSVIPLPPPKAVTPERHDTALSSSDHTRPLPLPPALVSPRRNTDPNGSRTLSNLGSTVVPPMRESRRISLGPDNVLDRRSSTMMMRTGTGTDIDWIVPVEEKEPHREKTVAERLQPTLTNAIGEMTKYASRAKWTGYGLNAAIGLQVVLGSLTTALSVVVKGSQVSVMTAVLGGFSTVVASYLARMRGSSEPELSITRVKDLEQFIRECEAFTMDHGHVTGGKFDHELDKLRGRFEELLGNANGERKLSTPV